MNAEFKKSLAQTVVNSLLNEMKYGSGEWIEVVEGKEWFVHEHEDKIYAYGPDQCDPESGEVISAVEIILTPTETGLNIDHKLIEDAKFLNGSR